MLHQLHDLTTLLNALPQRPDEELPVEINYPDRVYTVEHNIHAAIHTNRLDTRGDHQNLMSGMVNILLQASLLYIYTNLRQTPVGGAIRRTLSARLQRLLTRETDLAAFMLQYPGEMMWVGILGLSTGVEGSFWLDMVQRICLFSGANEWSDIERNTGCMPVLENVFRDSCERVWRKNSASSDLSGGIGL